MLSKTVGNNRTLYTHKKITEQYAKQYLYHNIVQAKLYIDSHFTDPIDLNKIADKAHFSKFHFIRLFKSIYGKTPHHYLITVRIAKAKELLESNMSVPQVCYSVGFNSVSTFKGLFKTHSQLTPFQFRQQVLKRKQEFLNTPKKFMLLCFMKKRQFSRQHESQR